MCSEGKYELPRASGQEKGRKSLANKENQTERKPAADFIFSSRNTLCAMPATTQPKSAKLHHNQPKERIWKEHLISKKN